MFCDASARCLECGADQTQTAAGTQGLPGPNPDNYLVAAIVLCLCWCLPFGLVSLVYAGKGSGLKEAGDARRASEYGAKARMWAWIGFGAGALIWIGYALLLMVGFLSEANSW
jgi:hypothetical protein